MTRHEYDEAMKEIEWIWNDAHKPEVRERFQALVIAVEEYEKVHFPLGEPTPIDIAEYNVDQGRLPCGHLNRVICSAAMCDGSPKLWHEANPEKP
jgi:antitoxin component HigA of HigAB toxin-antitoxin module